MIRQDESGCLADGCDNTVCYRHPTNVNPDNMMQVWSNFKDECEWYKLNVIPVIEVE